MTVPMAVIGLSFTLALICGATFTSLRSRPLGYAELLASIKAELLALRKLIGVRSKDQHRDDQQTKQCEDQEGNDFGSKRDFKELLIASLVVVLGMSCIITLLAKPEWLNPLEEAWLPIARFIQPWADKIEHDTFVVFMVVIMVFGSLPSPKNTIGGMSKTRFVLVLGFAAGIVVLWLTYNNWLVANLVAALVIANTVNSMQPRLSFLKLTTGLLIIAFAYDLIHVYVTGYMMDAANNVAAGVPGVPDANGQTPLTMPFLLTFPAEWSLYTPYVSQLGLGDVVAASLLASNAARIGRRINSWMPFAAAIVGYVVAMVIACVVMYAFNFAQPALIYIVPCMGISVILTVRLIGHTPELKRKPFAYSVSQMARLRALQAAKETEASPVQE